MSLFGFDAFGRNNYVQLQGEDECEPANDCEYCQVIPGGKKILKRHTYNWCNYPANKGCALITGPIKRHDGKTMFVVAKPKKGPNGYITIERCIVMG